MRKEGVLSSGLGWTLAITMQFREKNVFPFPLSSAKLTGDYFHNLQQGTEPELLNF